jgi:hypothetical protein
MKIKKVYQATWYDDQDVSWQATNYMTKKDAMLMAKGHGDWRDYSSKITVEEKFWVMDDYDGEQIDSLGHGKMVYLWEKEA